MLFSLISFGITWLFEFLFLFLSCRYHVENPLDKILSSRKHQHKSEKCHTETICNSQLTSDGDKKLKDSQEDLKATMISEELQATVKDKHRPRSGLIVRGMMAGPVASSPEVISYAYKILGMTRDFICNLLQWNNLQIIFK